MDCTVQFFLLNDGFSQELADQNEGLETPENTRYEWEDELKITVPVQEVNAIREGEYVLEGNLPSGESFSHSVPEMRLFEIKGDTTILVGCSEQLLDSYEIIREDEFVVRVYLKDYEPFANPVPGIYIASKAFPKELIP